MYFHIQAFLQAVFNDAEHKEEPLRPLSATEGTTGTVLSEKVPIHVNDFEPMRPLCATEDTSSTILGEHEIHANDCE